MYFNNEINILD